MIPGIMLAAGASTRFAPAHKLLMRYGDKTIIDHSVQTALNSSLTQVVVVTGYLREEIEDALSNLANHSKLQLIHNPDWKTGRASSLRAGLGALNDEVDGFLAWPADMSQMTSSLINDVVDTFSSTRQLCFPMYNQRKGHPVAFPIDWRQKLSLLEGDESGFKLIEEYWVDAVKLERSDIETQLNLNTKDDYDTLIRGQNGTT
jgi:molybdenum cofactor cytidylyltransferase